MCHFLLATVVDPCQEGEIIQILLWSSARGNPCHHLQRQNFPPFWSKSRECRLGSSPGRSYHCDHSKVAQGAHSYRNKAPFIYKSWQHLSPSPLAPSLLQTPVFLRKRTCILACARTSLRPHLLVVRYGYMTGFWPMESERESSVWPLGVS